MPCILRGATIDDARLLYEWRNDPAARSASRNIVPLDFESHVRWLEGTLKNSLRELLIAEIDGTPVGTVRLDRSAEGTELSWTVAPGVRRKGIGKAIVALACRRAKPPIYAEMQEGNIASIKIAEFAGMSLVKKKDGLLRFERAIP